MTQEVKNMMSQECRDLRYVDDTALLATTAAGLENFIKSLKVHSEQ